MSEVDVQIYEGVADLPQQLRRAAGLVREFYTDNYQPNGAITIAVTDGVVSAVLVQTGYDDVYDSVDISEISGEETVNTDTLDEEQEPMVIDQAIFGEPTVVEEADLELVAVNVLDPELAKQPEHPLN